MTKPDELTTLGSTIVYQNRWMIVREDRIRRQDGKESIYGVVQKPNFVVIVPVEDDLSVHLVEQYRYPVGTRLWELPQGAWEAMPDPDPVALARGELREETGLLAERMDLGGHLFQACGYATQSFHIFLARGLSHTERELDDEEQGLITRRFPWTTLLDMIRDGTIKDATTIASLGLLRMKGMLP